LQDETHIAIHNKATDPFLPKVKDVTFEILDGLDSLGYKNTIGLITKYSINNDGIAHLESLQNLEPIVFVTYSEMPKNIEPIGNAGRRRTLELLADSDIKTVLYWRPLVGGWNDDKDKMKKVLEVCEFADAIVVSGLKISSEMCDFFTNKEIPLPYMKWDPEHKKLPIEVVEKALTEYESAGLSVPLFRKTSCAVSYLEGGSDYNAHWYKAEENCMKTCPAEQKKRCCEVKEPRRSDVDSLLSNLGYDIDFEIMKDHVRLNSLLEREERTYLRHNLRFPVI
jgi:DNA repair photolyase